MAYFAFVQEGDFMIKVVIADDEARICQLIKVLVDWDALGMEIAGIASNGIEALMMVRKERSARTFSLPISVCRERAGSI